MTSAERTTSTTRSAGVWWDIKLGKHGHVASDSLTLDEVERIETITDTPWSVGNPLASIRQAKGWLLVAAMHLGLTEDEATAYLASLNLVGIKGAVQLHAGDAPALELVDDGFVPPVPPSSAPTSAIG